MFIVKIRITWRADPWSYDRTIKSELLGLPVEFLCTARVEGYFTKGSVNDLGDQSSHWDSMSQPNRESDLILNPYPVKEVGGDISGTLKRCPASGLERCRKRQRTRWNPLPLHSCTPILGWRHIIGVFKGCRGTFLDSRLMQTLMETEELVVCWGL